MPLIANGCPSAYFAPNATSPGLTVATAAIEVKSARFRWFFNKKALWQPLQFEMVDFRLNKRYGDRYTSAPRSLVRIQPVRSLLPLPSSKSLSPISLSKGKLDWTYKFGCAVEQAWKKMSVSGTAFESCVVSRTKMSVRLVKPRYYGRFQVLMVISDR